MHSNRFIIKKKTDFGYSSLRQHTKDRHSWQRQWIFFNIERVELSTPSLETREEMKHDWFGCFVKVFNISRI